MLLTTTVIAHANESLVPKGSLKFGKFLKNLKTSCELERKPEDLAPRYCAQNLPWRQNDRLQPTK